MTKFAAATWNGKLRVSSGFGAFESFRSAPHRGVDTINPGPRYAPFDGIVTRGIDEGNAAPRGLGNYFQMVSLDGRFVYTIAHCNTNSDAGRRKGERIKARTEVVRDMGRPPTGFVTGPHYHEQLSDNGRLVNFLDYLGKTWGEATKPVPQPDEWDGVSTLYKGKYADDGLVYTIRVGETIWGVATAKGVSLDQVRAWTAALASSKYASAQLAKSGPGASWWDGSGRYFAGATFAVQDVVGLLAAEDARVAEAAQAAAQQAEEVAAEALAAAQIAADAGEVVTTTDTEAELAAAVESRAAAELARAEAEAELAAAVERARAALPQIEADADRMLTGDAQATGALSGLFAGNDRARKRAYLWYAGIALLISFGPDVVVANVLADELVPTFVAYVSLASSILLKIGTALGFVAASNTVKRS